MCQTVSSLPHQRTWDSSSILFCSLARAWADLQEAWTLHSAACGAAACVCAAGATLPHLCFLCSSCLELPVLVLAFCGCWLSFFSLAPPRNSRPSPWQCVHVCCNRHRDRVRSRWSAGGLDVLGACRRPAGLRTHLHAPELIHLCLQPAALANLAHPGVGQAAAVVVVFCHTCSNQPAVINHDPHTISMQTSAKEPVPVLSLALWSARISFGGETGS